MDNPAKLYGWRDEQTRYIAAGLAGNAMKRLAAVSFTVVASVVLCAVPARADDFYQGKTITFIVATGPGGGYDSYARLIANHMKRYLPGSNIIVKNVPGAGHIIGANQIYAAKPDGLTIGTFNTGLIYSQLLKSQGVMFDMSKFTAIGKAASEPKAVIVSTASGITSIDGLKSPGKKLFFATSGVGSASYGDAKMLVETMGWNVGIIPAYSGREDELAMLRGEVTGTVAVSSSFDQMVKNGLARFLMQMGGAPRRGVPLASSFGPTGQAQSVVALISAISELGRLVMAPPGLPSERAAALRAAYKSAMESPDLLADAKKQQLPIDPAYADQVATLIARALNQDAKTIAMISALMSAKP